MKLEQVFRFITQNLAPITTPSDASIGGQHCILGKLPPLDVS